MNTKTFTPAYGQTQSVAVSGTGQITGLPMESNGLLLSVAGSQIVYIRLTNASSAVNASATDCPVLPGSQILLKKNGGSQRIPDPQTRLAYYSEVGGSVLIVTPGEVS